MDPLEQTKYLSSILPPPQITCRSLTLSSLAHLPGNTLWKPAFSKAQLGLGDKDIKKLHCGLKGLRMGGERGANVSLPYDDSRYAMAGVWGLPKLRKQGGLPRGGNA